MSNIIDPDDIEIRDAVVADIPFVKDLYDKTGPVVYDDAFYARLRKAVEEKVYDTSSTSGGDRFVMKVATVIGSDGKTRLAGAIALTTMKLKAPDTPSSSSSSSASSSNSNNKNRGLLPTHELVEQVDNNTRGAYILLLAVYPKYRRNEIGHDLLREAVSEVVSIADSRRALDNGNTQVVFLHVPRGEKSAEGFLNYEDFTPLGYVPKFWGSTNSNNNDGSTDAIVWAKAFHNGELVHYKVPKGEQYVNLSDPETKPVRSRCPKWVGTVACQFGLPLGIVGILFIISYLLVLLGPLRGISSRYMKDEGPSFNIDEYVEDDGNVEL